MKKLKGVTIDILVMTHFLHEERGKEMMTVLSRGFRKIRAPTYEAEVNTGEKDEEWLLGMSKYFQVHNYSSVMQDRLSIYNLSGKAAR